MINKEDFKEIQTELREADKRRESTIQLSREIIKESKLIIYSIHRDENPTLDKIKSMINKLERENATGIERTAVQEYVEAACFYHYIYDNKLPTRQDLEVDSESYLLGLCDLTGELLRKAVKDVIKGNKDNALKITKVVEEIYGEFLQFDLRNGELRKKSDSIKWNLQKLEQLSLDISKN